MTGITGGTGISGVTGLLGVNGVTGLIGLTGLALGATGVRGLTGLASGPQGPTGVSPAIRLFTTVTTSTLTPDMTSYDRYSVTAQSTDSTIANPIGTPSDFQSFVIRYAGDSAAHGLGHGTLYVPGGVALLTSIPANKNVWEGFFYHSDDTKYYCVAANTEA